MRSSLQHRVFEGVEGLLQRANYERIDPTDVEMILTRDSHYGLDLAVDMKAFERIVIYYRGASNQKYERRRVTQVSAQGGVRRSDLPEALHHVQAEDVRGARCGSYARPQASRDAAEKWVNKRRRQVCRPASTRRTSILKLFKNIPRTDIEMVFPNTEVKFRSLDKLRLGMTAGQWRRGRRLRSGRQDRASGHEPDCSGHGALAGLGGIAARQAMGFLNQKQRYMVVMAQNLYFHTMADNRGVILKIAARGAEEDVKEEMLLYSVLAKEKATRADLPSIDLAIESYLTRTFGVKVDFEIDDALDRLIRDGIVVEKPDGTFVTLPPAEAAKHIDAKWDLFLDYLPDPFSSEGYEFEGKSVSQPA